MIGKRYGSVVIILCFGHTISSLIPNAPIIMQTFRDFQP